MRDLVAHQNARGASKLGELLRAPNGPPVARLWVCEGCRHGAEAGQRLCASCLDVERVKRHGEDIQRAIDAMPEEMREIETRKDVAARSKVAAGVIDDAVKALGAGRRVLLLRGASGAGKTTLACYLLRQGRYGRPSARAPRCGLQVRHRTRPRDRSRRVEAR